MFAVVLVLKENPGEMLFAGFETGQYSEHLRNWKRLVWPVNDKSERCRRLRGWARSWSTWVRWKCISMKILPWIPPSLSRTTKGRRVGSSGLQVALFTSPQSPDCDWIVSSLEQSVGALTGTHTFTCAQIVGGTDPHTASVCTENPTWPHSAEWNHVGRPRNKVWIL